jgi:hypothetical protein
LTARHCCGILIQLDSTPLFWYFDATLQHTTVAVLRFKWTACHCCGIVMQMDSTPLLWYFDTTSQHTTAVVL